MLHVWKVSGEELAIIPVEELGSVRSLKQQLQCLCGVPRFRQRLLVDGAALADDVILDSPIHVQLVLLPFADISVEQQPELTIAAAGGLVDNVEDMLQRPWDPDSPFCGFTPLHAAAEHGQSSIARLLLEARADKDKSDRHGRTPLWLASQDGHVEIVQLLLDCGAKRDKCDHYRRTPLWVASLRAHVDVVQLLLHAAVEGIDQADMYGRTPLWEAAQSGHTEVVRLLLQASADTDSGDIYSRTPLCEAAQHGHVAVVRVLLQAGAEKGQSDFFGSTPISVKTKCMVLAMLHLKSVRAGPGFPAAGFQQGAAAAGASGRWGPGGYSGPAPGAGAGSGASSSASGAKGFVERIAKGDVLVGADAAKRLVSQCSHAKTTAKQLAEMVCERSRRLYLGLDGGDPAEADAALARLLALTDAIYSSDTSDFAKTAVEEIKKGVSEEFMSLRSSAKHKDGALPALQRLGFLGAKAAQEADLLGGEAEVDLLGGGGAVQAAAPSADLLGGEQSSSAPSQPASAGLVDTLDPLLSAPSAPSGGLLAGLALDAPAPASAPAAPAAPAAPGAKAGTLGAGATLPKDSAKEDIFGFVGAEMSKANK
ncbi:Ankyrin-1 [Symbiodinium microadriaticum]|uniref:Ankyrin-1 n=1 Tax=Symbiodinium microadriaticum TaxID=2951 RepID=A0A1Q9EBT5_SYMMI|nr:Ankyrin-1 [Symbiodinium microadriaticum]